MSEEKKEKKRRISGLTAVILALAVLSVLFVVLAVLNNRGRGGQLDSIDALDSYVTFEAQSGSTYAMMDSSLVTVSGIEVNVYDKDGKQTVNSQFTAEKPAVAACGTRAVAYDVGGTAYMLVSKSKVVAEGHAIGDIVSATMNDKGYMALCTKEEGYKGAVTVYDSAGTAVYRWSSANGYVYDAVVSPSCKSCAVLCFDQQEESLISRVTLLSIRREETLGSFETVDNALIAVGYLGSDCVACVGESSTVFLARDGKQRAAYDYADRDLEYFSLEGENHVVLAFSESTSDMSGTLVSVNTKGRELGSIQVIGSIKYLRASRQQTAVFVGESLRMFTHKLAEDGGVENTGGAKAVFLNGSDAVLISNSDAKYYDR